MRSEKRRAPRFPVDLPARVRSYHVSLDGRAWNISQDGILFVTSGIPTADAEVVLQIDLPDDAPLELVGQVRWMRPGEKGGMGIRFRRALNTQRMRDYRRLANFVLRQSARR